MHIYAQSGNWYLQVSGHSTIGSQLYRLTKLTFANSLTRFWPSNVTCQGRKEAGTDDPLQEMCGLGVDTS